MVSKLDSHRNRPNTRRAARRRHAPLLSAHPARSRGPWRVGALGGGLFRTASLLPAQGRSITELLEIWGQFGNFMIKLRNKITKPEKTAE